MWFMARKVVAVVLMTASAGGLAAVLWGTGLRMDKAGVAVVVMALVVGTVALARNAWWGRLLALAWGMSVAILAALILATGGLWTLPYLAGALVLLGCLGGQAMFAAYEGSAPPPLDWRQPGMGLIRAAVVANLCGFLGGVTIAPPIFAVQHQHPLYLHSPIDPTLLLVTCLIMTALSLAGVVLLARQRTAGLMLLAVAAAGLPLALIAYPGALDDTSAWLFAGLFGPGIVCGWMALGRYLPRMVRFLRA